MQELVSKSSPREAPVVQVLFVQVEVDDDNDHFCIRKSLRFNITTNLLPRLVVFTKAHL